MSETSVLEFGFSESKIIKSTAVEQFKQSRPNEKTRISVVSFKRIIDGVFAKETMKKGSHLTDQEKADLVTRVDAKLADHLKKKPEELTEVDRLDIREPRFAMAFTHYNDAVGTIRCMSKYEGSTLATREVCCDKFGEADQTVGTVIMSYPVDSDLQVDADILKAKKMTNFWIWKLGAKKFKRVESTYVDARNAKVPVIDLKVTLDGDPKFQKQVIEQMQGPAFWARDESDPNVRNWILDQGLRCWKYVSQNLGFEIKKEAFLEKIGQARPALSSEASSATAPRAVASYDDLLT